MKTLRLLLTLLGLLAFTAARAGAATLTVTNLNDSGAGSLRQAIADAAASGDTIVFAAGLSGQTIPLTSGEIVLNKSLTIDGSALSGRVTVSGNNASRIFTVSSGQTVALKDLTLTGGNGTGASSIDNGGAIFNQGTLTLTQCTLSDNGVTGYGGAILNSSTLALAQCTLSGNSATYGGAIDNEGTLTLTQCTLSDNGAAYGGAILNYSPLALTHCTLSGNIAGTNGGAIHNASNTVTLTNSVVAGSIASLEDIYNSLNATLTSVGANFVQSFTNAGTLNGSGTISNAAPLLAPLDYYGGPTQTMPPLPGSPAIDGVPDGSEFAGLTTDQRGFPRPAGVRADIGAVEVQSALMVTNNLDDGSIGSLRQAVLGAGNGATIAFAPGLSGGTIILNAAKGEIVLSRSVTIDASGLSGGVTIDGGPGTNRIFFVNGGQTVALKGLTLTGGNASSGGAIFNSAGSLTLTQCTLTNSSVADFGGAIFNLDGSTLALTQCTLSGNSAGYGGALYNRGALTLTHCTLSGNFAPFEGGAIVNWVGTLTLTNSIVAGSPAPSPEDIRNGFFGTLTRVGANIVQSFTNYGTLNGSGTISNAAPLLAPLGNYGGPTQTMPPLPGSPAIDGVPAGSEVAGLTTDQRGFPRQLDGDGNGSIRVDIGAVELRRIIVTTAADELDTPTGAQTSLREAIRDNADAETSADVITFVPGLNGGTITLDAAKGEIVLSRSTTIDARDLSGGVTIHGGNATRIFFVDSGQSVALMGLTLTGGDAAHGLSDGFGGAIQNFGTLTLTHCTLSGNSATFNGDFGGFGGGIYNYYGTLTLTHCTLSGNSATYFGGAIYNDNGPLTLTQCTLSGSSASLGGGAIYNDNGMLTLTQCTLSGNSANYGGAIDNSLGALALTQCTLTGNSADYGGAIIGAGPLTLTQCTLSGNSASLGGGAIYNDGPLLLTNGIVAGNTAPSGADIINYGTLTRVGANIVQSLFNDGGTVNGTGTISTAAPLLAPLGNYGGPTPTMALLTGSPARNAAAVLVPAITGDQRGFPIIGTPDIGAYEAGTFTNYNAWSYETLPSGANYTFTADQENDGNKNGLEYATRTNPLAANPNPFGEPERVTLQPSNVAAYQFSFPYRPGATDLRYIVYRSPDLATWTEIYRADLPTGTVIELGLVTGDENTTTQIITITDPGFTLPACFWKLTVEKP